MDRKSIIVIIGCIVLYLVWSQAIVPKLVPPRPQTQQPATGAPLVTTGAPQTTVTATSTVPVMTAAPATPAPRLLTDTNAPEELLVVTNDNARYTFTSRGGGLQSVELVRYRETVTRRKDETNHVATLNTPVAAPTLAMLGEDGVQGDGIFTLTPMPNGVRAEKDLTNGLSIVREFQLGTNYLVSAIVRLHNRSAEALALPAQEWVVGTATPMNAEDDGNTTVGLMWFNGKKTASMLGASHFSSRGFACMPRVPAAEYREGEGNVAWVAVYNQFFTLVVMPGEPASQVVSRKIDLPRPTTSELAENGRWMKTPAGYATTLVYPALTLAPGQTVERAFQVFAGPKEYRTLARIASRFHNELDAVMSFGWFGWFSKALLLSMNWLHHVLHLSYGWAIIAITIIIKLLFWPLTTASTRSMKRMQALQPEMKAIQAKYKDDPMKAQRKTMEFMKENKVNPMGGCLPMMLQMPVFIGFFYMIRSAIELRGESFLWVLDLSRPDTLFMIPGLNFPFNLLPLLMGATMLWQAHLTPPSPGMDPVQQKMMRYLPLMFMVFLYSFSAGLTLYWTVQNLLTIAQTKLTKTIAPPTPAAKAPVLTPPRKKRKQG